MLKPRWAQWGALVGGVVALLTAALYWLLSGTSSATTAPGVLMYLVLAAVSGAGYGALLRAERAYSDERIHPSVGLIYGLVNWILFEIIIIPVIAGRQPAWDAAAAAALFDRLIIYLVYGVILTLVLRWMQAAGWLSIAPIADIAMPDVDHRRIVILGGGFAGVTTAQQLEQALDDDPHVQITLVSKTNHLLFTPMLAEVTAGGVEAPHISPPLRAFFRHVRVMRAEPIQIDIVKHTVTVQTPTGSVSELPYNHLVLALGAIPNFFGNQNLEKHAFTFKSLADAIQIRNHVIECLERADVESDPERCRRLLTFVVVGAGFAGTELIGGLNDFVRGSLWYYRQLHNDDITLLLLHPIDRILPELSNELALYAEQKLTTRGVTVRGNAKVTDAARGSVSVGDDLIFTETLIWAAGNAPHPLLKQFGFETDKRGAVITDEMLRVKGQSHIWALGDCAVVPDLVTGKTAPATAQYALREAKTLAYNLHVILRGGEPKAFRHRSQGALAVIGHQTACAEVFGFKFSGLFAWLMWRGIYLSKLPTLEKKVRVLLDWLINIFFPRDITHAPLVDEADEPPVMKEV